MTIVLQLISIQHHPFVIAILLRDLILDKLVVKSLLKYKIIALLYLNWIHGYQSYDAE